MTHRAVFFHRASAPYEAGDIAGFPAAHAQRLVTAGVATYHPSQPAAVPESPETAGPDLLDGMDRAALIAFAKEHLGVTDVPPENVADEALREAIRAEADEKLLKRDPEHLAGADPALLKVRAAAGKTAKKG